MPADVRVGTSGWQYKHWMGSFYPPQITTARTLDYYCKVFNTVEVNNSFYRLPSADTFARWRITSPKQFVFAVKGSRYLTHAKKLKDPEPGIERLFSSLEALQEKLGPVLFQLPPQFGINLERLESFLVALPPGHRYTFEFRHESWNTPQTYKLLKKFNAAYCIFHLAGFQSPIEVTADFAYIRLHGPGGKYQGKYSTADLGKWAAKIRRWKRRLKAVYVYFDNDQAGYAAENARELVALLDTAPASHRNKHV